jgi:hypothetical protein
MSRNFHMSQSVRGFLRNYTTKRELLSAMKFITKDDGSRFSSPDESAKVAAQRSGLAIRILAILAEENFPGLTRGELRDRLGVPPDTEITARLRELRDYASYGNFDVRVEHKGGKAYSYWLPPRERWRAKAFLQQWRAA